MMDLYFIIMPQIPGGFKEEWRQCLDQIISTGSTGKKLIKLNIFIDIEDYETYLKTRNEIGNAVRSAFGDQCPAYSITVNPPEKPWKVVIEAGYMDANSRKITYKVWNSIPYVVIEADNEKEIWAGGFGSGLHSDNTRKAARAAFDQMRALLEVEKMTFNHIVRQWNFVGNILEIKDELQNYQIFNEVRSENFHKYRTIHSYPAATGIGMKFGGICLDCLAVTSENNLKIIAIDNPEQIRPYDYGQQVLKGKPLEGKKTKQPPQFERAVHLSNNLASTLFVSGTASIVGQETIGIDDVEKQTVVTIENISRLTDPTRIGHLTGNADADPGNLILLRVYIKNQDDFLKVKAICEEYFPNVTANYIEADVCRDNLLVEIEAEILKN